MVTTSFMTRKLAVKQKIKEKMIDYKSRQSCADSKSRTLESNEIKKESNVPT